MLVRKLLPFAWLLLIACLFAVFSQLAWFNELSSIANDSVNYLVMAQHYSPWVDTSPAVNQLWAEQDFPPLFPLLLAVSGTAHSLLYAHILVTLIGMLALWPLYQIGKSWLADSRWSFLVVVIFALSPGYLLGMQGILSESLYLLLSLTFLWFYQTRDKDDNVWILGMSFLLAGLLLTRTIGIALCLALIAQSVINSIRDKNPALRSFVLPMLAIIVFLLFLSLFGPEKDSHYPAVISDYLQGKSAVTSPGFITTLKSQLLVLFDAWRTSWIIYWVDEYALSHLVILYLLLAAAFGLLLRLRENYLDAWYTLFYIVVLLAWPHPGQMVRLLLPIMPLLLLHAAYSTNWLAQYWKSQTAIILIGFYMVLLAAILPAQFYIQSRLKIAIDENMVPVYESFRKVDQKEAMHELAVQNRMLNDFRHLEELLTREEKILYVIPEYPAILANRQSTKIVFGAYREQIYEKAKFTAADYVYLTHIHPRKTRVGYAGIKPEPLEGWTQLVWCSYDKANAINVSCLYRVIK